MATISAKNGVVKLASGDSYTGPRMSIKTIIISNTAAGVDTVTITYAPSTTMAIIMAASATTILNIEDCMTIDSNFAVAGSGGTAVTHVLVY